MTPEDLQLVHLDDLLNELKNRFPDMVFAGQKKETENGRLDTFDFVGDYTNCSGLCCLLIHKINQDRDSSSEALDSSP